MSSTAQGWTGPAPIPAPAAATTAAPKVGWLKHVGQVIGKILGIVAKDAAPAADVAAKVAEALLPQYAPEIASADGLVTKIAKEAIVAEGVAAAAGTAVGGGTAKLEAVLTNIGPAIDGWVSSNFPGASAVSKASKAGLVSAVVTIMNELEGKSPVAPSA